MSTLATIHRHRRIISILKQRPASFEELLSVLKDEEERLGVSLAISNRTFLRDKADILELYGIDIKTNKSNNTYYIDETAGTDYISHAFEMMQLARLAQGLEGQVYFDARRPLGMGHLPDLLLAIRESKSVSFAYSNIWKGDTVNYTVHPLALKEAQGRWYLIAGVPERKHAIRFFGLDRISHPDIGKPYKHRYTVDFSATFQHFFGAFVVDGMEPERIELAFTIEQGRYVENYPLHHSQQTVRVDVENHELVVSLCLCITQDFVMELLRYGDELTVLAPQLLATQLQRICKNALASYNHTLQQNQ